MFSFLTQFGTSSSSSGILGLSVSGFLIQLATFVIAFLILRKWAFKPIMRIMNERRDAIEKGVTLGQQMEKEKADLEERVEKTLHETRKKADSIIADAQETARQMVREAEDQAKDKAASILKDNETRTQQEMQRAWRQLEGQLASLVADATEVVIEEKVDETKDSALITRAIKEHMKA